MRKSLAGVFHIHTRHSFDSLTSPASIVDWAKRNEIGVLGITDHNTIRGAQEAASHSRESGVQVIVGAEYESTHGDVIGLFLTEEICSRDPVEIIEAIRKQGGISILPHPYHGHRKIEELAQAVDMIEAFNARCSDKENRQALELATSLKKPTIGGADAHFLKDMKSCICSLNVDRPITPDDLLSSQRTWIEYRSSKSRLHLSQVIKGLKVGDSALMRSHLRALFLMHVKSAIGKGLYGRARDVWKQNG
jgi:predicted metal-dependent phosphoesterase TrpH